MKTVVSEATVEEALAYICGTLTHPQRRALVASVVQPLTLTMPVLAGAGQHTARVLQQGKAPLVVQEGANLFLTPLGVAVGHYLNETGDWDLPDFGDAA